VSGEYGVTKEDGETVVGEAMPKIDCQPRVWTFTAERYTFWDLLATVNLLNLLLQKLVTLLADCHNLLSSNTKSRDCLQDLLRNLGSIFVFGQSVRVVQGIVYEESYQRVLLKALHDAVLQTLNRIAGLKHPTRPSLRTGVCILPISSASFLTAAMVTVL
jgi:hypothetical protein